MSASSQPQPIKIYGLILARKNSKGIKNKNITPLGGVPLIALAVRVMKRSNCFAEVWVSTDDPAIECIAKEEDALVHKRSSYTATDEASSVLAVQEFLRCHPGIDNICLVQCTSPFLKEIYLEKGRDIFITSMWDSVFSVTRKPLLRWSQDCPCVPLNFDLTNRPQRQSFAGDVCENGMFYFSQRKFIEEGILQGGRCNYVEIPEEDSLDINTPFELFLAQQVLNFRKINKY